MGIPTLKAHTVSFETEPRSWARMCRLAILILLPLWTRRILRARGGRGSRLGLKFALIRTFQKGTNVEFVRVTDTNRIEFRIFERGVGPTLSSGTGSSASAAASIEMRSAARTLTVVAEGGAQTVEWPHPNSSLVLTGPAEIIAQGECLLA